MAKPKPKTARVRLRPVAPHSGIAASMVIYRAGEMTPDGRRDIADWLRARAKHLLKHGGNYSTRFRARFGYGFQPE